MNTFSTVISKYDYKTVIYDILALTVVTFTPALSHLTAIPIYLLDPMRIILLLSIVYTSKKNVFLLAFVLPLLSFIISAHPYFIKSLLIASELTVNAFLFFYMSKFFKNSFVPAILSITISKIYYYVVKLSLIGFGLISTDLVSTPIILQAIVAVSISVYLWLFFRKERMN
ncbi:MAG: hypothetical protein NTX65_06095 [Ignavibacteriales bacterium]|nr:hypothetical protein [Ignavibacteriales bacterium]